MIDKTLASRPVTLPAGVRLSWGSHGAVAIRPDGQVPGEFVLRPVSLGGQRFSPGPFVFGPGAVTEDLGHGITAWYKTSASGVEQGFTLTQRPAGDSARFSIMLSYSGGLTARAAEPNVIELHGPDGQALSYGGLRVTDRTGRVLPSRFAVNHSLIQITVSEAGAAYPLTVDPYITPSADAAATFSGTPGSGEELGYSVALSANGQTALIGAPAANVGSSPGAAYLYTASATGTWPATPTATFTEASGSNFGSVFGRSVALSADGQTALVGAAASGGTDGNNGAAYLYTASAGWSNTPAATLTGQGGGFGDAVALSGDGRTALIGAPSTGADNVDGTAYLYSESALGAWPSAPTADFGAPSASRDGLGYSVALSGDGQTALIGAPGANSHDGAAYLYLAPSGTWSATPAWGFPFTPVPGSAAALGFSVALSSNGQTALVGAPTTIATGATGATGAAYLYTGGAGWSSYLTATFLGTTADVSELGWSAALSANGQVALVGTNAGEGPAGSADLYTALSGWSDTPAATFNGKTQNDDVGQSVALSADGQDALIGAPAARTTNEADGAAYLYMPSNATTTTLTASPSPATAGAPVTLTATEAAADGTNPAGSIQFEVGGTDIGSPVAVNASGVATTTTTFAAAGTVSLTAVFIPANTSSSYVGSTGAYSLIVNSSVTPIGGVVPLSATAPPYGAFTVTVTPGTVNLAVSGSTATAAMSDVTVTDTRNYYPGWSVSGQESNFAGSGTAAGSSIQGNQLGWTPAVVGLPQGGAILGQPVAPAAPGLGTTAATLASAPAGSGYGTNVLSADLSLDIPPATAAGPYSGTITLTFVEAGP